MSRMGNPRTDHASLLAYDGSSTIPRNPPLGTVLIVQQPKAFAQIDRCCHRKKRRAIQTDRRMARGASTAAWIEGHMLS